MGERTVGEWVISTHIGSGSFAIVWKARHRLTGQESAIKEIALDKLNSKLRQSLESEVSILKRINHDNIVKLLEVFEVSTCGWEPLTLRGQAGSERRYDGVRGVALTAGTPAATPVVLPVAPIFLS